MATHTQEFAHGVKGRLPWLHHEFTGELGNERFPVRWFSGCCSGFDGTRALSYRFHGFRLRYFIPQRNNFDPSQHE
jgi:hypothetical protein